MKHLKFMIILVSTYFIISNINAEPIFEEYGLGITMGVLCLLFGLFSCWFSFVVIPKVVFKMFILAAKQKELMAK